MPILVENGITHWDSLAIIVHLADLHPRLCRATPPPARGPLDQREMHSGFEALRNELPMNVRAAGRKVTPSPKAEADIARVSPSGARPECRFGKEGPWLFGPFTAADAMFTPVASRFRSFGITLPETLQPTNHGPRKPAMREWTKRPRPAGDYSSRGSGIDAGRQRSPRPTVPLGRARQERMELLRRRDGACARTCSALKGMVGRGEVLPPHILSPTAAGVAAGRPSADADREQHGFARPGTSGLRASSMTGTAAAVAAALGVRANLSSGRRMRQRHPAATAPGDEHRDAGQDDGDGGDHQRRRPGRHGLLQPEIGRDQREDDGHEGEGPGRHPGGRADRRGLRLALEIDRVRCGACDPRDPCRVEQHRGRRLSGGR